MEKPEWIEHGMLMVDDDMYSQSYQIRFTEPFTLNAGDALEIEFENLEPKRHRIVRTKADDRPIIMKAGTVVCKTPDGELVPWRPVYGSLLKEEEK